MLVTLACAGAETISHNWKSYIHGDVYESSVTPDVLQASSKLEHVQISPQIGGDVEQRGRCDIKQAIRLADLEAGKLIGDEYPGKNPTWIMEKAERVRTPSNGSYESSHYEIIYRQIIPRSDFLTHPLGLDILHVIILLDDTVLPIKSLGKASDQHEHTQVDVRWKGASAEELVEQLKPLLNDADLTVAEDGKATLYFNAETSDVAAKARVALDHFPKELKLVRVERVETAIPATPEQVKKQHIIYSIDNERAKTFGISADTISNHIKSFGDLSDPENLKKNQETNIKLPNGLEVPLRNLVEFNSIEVKRPLIIYKK